MTKHKTDRIHVQCQEGTKVRLTALALNLGYVNVRSRWTGQGSITRLMEAIASGELSVVAPDVLENSKVVWWKR